MMVTMKYRLLTLCVTLAVFIAPLIAFAKEDEESARLEGRLEGYATTVRMASGGTALTWLMIGFLSAAAIATLFKNAKRTHLD